MAQATVAMLARVVWRDGNELPADVVAKLRASVVRRESMAYEDAALADVFETAAALLRAERDAISGWRVSRTGFRAVAAGLERTARASRRAMVKALATSRIEDYREWRQRVKDALAPGPPARRALRRRGSHSTSAGSKRSTAASANVTTAPSCARS